MLLMYPAMLDNLRGNGGPLLKAIHCERCPSSA
jgi:hypothetical protein